MTMSGALLHVWDHQVRILSKVSLQEQQQSRGGRRARDEVLEGCRPPSVKRPGGVSASWSAQQPMQREQKGKENLCERDQGFSFFFYFTVTKDQSSITVEGSVGEEAAGEPLIFFFNRAGKTQREVLYYWHAMTLSFHLVIGCCLKNSQQKVCVLTQKRILCVFAKKRVLAAFEQLACETWGLFPDALIYKSAPRSE